MGVWLWLSPLETGVPLRGEAGGEVEGLCEKVLAGKLHPQGNKRKGMISSMKYSIKCICEIKILHLS